MFSSEMTDGPDEDRAERLRRTRKRSKLNAMGAAEEANPSSPDDEIVMLQVELTEELKRDLENQFQDLSERLTSEAGRELKTSQEYYRLILEHGVDSVKAASIGELRAMLEEQKED